MGPSYCATTCDLYERCFAEMNEDWEGDCLKTPPEVLEVNEFAWYVFQRNITQWEYAGMDGIRVSLKSSSIDPWLAQAGYEGPEWFDCKERIQMLELAYINVARMNQSQEAERAARERENEKKVRERVEVHKVLGVGEYPEE